MRNAIAILLWLVLTILSTQDLRAQAVKLMASDASALAFFGYAVALSGEYAVVGAPGEDADTGAAYVFVNDPVDGWTRKAKLTADAPAIGDAFGFSVDIDGSFIVVGTPGDDDGGNDAGAAYVFFNDPVAGWTRQAKLTTPDAALEDRLGYAVAISGIFIIVGAPGHDDGAFETGAAYAFTFNPPTGWSQQAKLSAPSAEEGDFFSETVALDDATALIGAPSADDPRGRDAGLAFVFVRSGTAWSHRATLTAGNAASNRRFGAAVALGTEPLRDVQFALVGAPGAGGSSVGAAYVFVDRDMLWTQVASLAPDVVVAGSHFGTSVALSGDDAVVGALDADASVPHPGAVHTFSEDPFNDWPRQATLMAPGAEMGVQFGHAVALDDTYLVVGAPEDNEGAQRAGAVYVYDRSSLNTATEALPEPPSSLFHLANYPNPFRRATTIAFEVPALAAVPVRLAIYDVLGREVTTLIDQSTEPGRHEVTWTAEDLPSGVYVYRLQIGDRTPTRPMLLIR